MGLFSKWRARRRARKETITTKEIAPTTSSIKVTDYTSGESVTTETVTSPTGQTTTTRTVSGSRGGYVSPTREAQLIAGTKELEATGKSVYVPPEDKAAPEIKRLEASRATQMPSAIYGGIKREPPKKRKGFIGVRREYAREMKGEGDRISDRKRRKLQEELNKKYGGREVSELEFKQYEREQELIDSYGMKFFARARATSPFKIKIKEVAPIFKGTVVGQTSALGTLGKGFIATPKAIVGMGFLPKPVKVRFAGVSQRIKDSKIITKIGFKTSTGYRGVAVGATKIVARKGQIVAGRTIVKGGMGRYAYKIPSGRIKVFKPTTKRFLSLEKSITGGGKIQLIKDFKVFKVSKVTPASLGVSAGKVVVKGVKGKPIVSAYKSITAGIKIGKRTTEFASITGSTKGAAYSRGIIKSISSYKTKIGVGKITTPTGLKSLTKFSLPKLSAVQLTKSGIRAAATTTKPLSFVKAFTTFKPLIPSVSALGFISPKVKTKPPVNITQPQVTTKQITTPKIEEIQKTTPIIKTETRQKEIQKYGSSLGLTQIPKQTLTPRQIPIQTPIITTIPKQIIKQTPIQRLTPITPTTPYIPTPKIPIIPAITIPRLPFPSSRAKGAGDLLGGFGSRYTPSFAALTLKIKGKKPRKAKFTGLELRPITPSFKWFKRKKKKWGWGIK